jgi:hypothetical protein
MNCQNGKGVSVTSANSLKTYQDEQSDFASDEANGKAFASMRARAALCGCTLHELSDGYLVGRWGCSKAMPCLRSVGDLLRRIGGGS